MGPYQTSMMKRLLIDIEVRLCSIFRVVWWFLYLPDSAKETATLQQGS